MLVLKRRIGESIRVGSNVEIRFVSIRGNHAKVGIQAPRTIKILRGELFEADYERLPEDDETTTPGDRDSLFYWLRTTRCTPRSFHASSRKRLRRRWKLLPAGRRRSRGFAVHFRLTAPIRCRI
jgi:carbon storage regulator CsrA